MESGNAPCLKPNPQAFASGAMVMSKAPSVSLEISMERLKQVWKKLSVIMSSFRFTREITDVSLNGDNEASKRFNSASISGFRSPSY